MDITILNPPPPKPTETEVVEALNRHDIPLHLWGTGNHRSLDDFIEYMQNDRFHWRDHLIAPIVDVYVVVAIITHSYRRQWLELYEDHQDFGNGHILGRENFNGIAETLKREEGLIDGVSRCLKEELGFHDKAKFKILPNCEIERRAPAPSEKFPGILAVYHRHVFECEISRDIFSKGGYAEKEKNRTIHFKWKPRGQNHLRI